MKTEYEPLLAALEEALIESCRRTIAEEQAAPSQQGVANATAALTLAKAAEAIHAVRTGVIPILG